MSKHLRVPFSSAYARTGARARAPGRWREKSGLCAANRGASTTSRVKSGQYASRAVRDCKACSAASEPTMRGAATNGHSRALLCTSICASSVAEALATVLRANSSHADVLELRLDFYHDFRAEERDLEALIQACDKPCIVTFRPIWEGGKYDGQEEGRLQALWRAASLGAAYVDVELEAIDAFRALGEELPESCHLILSHHNFSSTLPAAQLADVEQRMRDAGADVAKIAMMANDVSDAWAMLQLLQRRSGPMIALSMGERGVITRILASKYGGFLTFGALTAGDESAPGQPTIDELHGMYRSSLQGAATRVLGVVGNPVKHSRSPVLHNAAMAHVGFDGVYVPLLVDDMDAFVETFQDADWAGFSVTIPHKEAACRLSNADGVAAKIGAVNTLVRRPDGAFDGHNTDWDAAITAVEAAINRQGGASTSRPLAGMTAVVLGTGGAARALAFGAAERGADVVVAGRSEGKAAALASQVGDAGASAVTATTIEAVRAGQLPRMDVILNTTPLGMEGDRAAETPVPQSVLASFQPVVFDAVYTPLQTRLLREADACGCTCVEGLEMFVGQAAEQFRYFTGTEAPRELMRETVLRSLSGT